ncbi:MAG: family 10 glycosylhydrolase [Clostridia bacterium]|nr:family 10 glycosylhydrolase [Clostridia bacterium]
MDEQGNKGFWAWFTTKKGKVIFFSVLWGSVLLLLIGVTVGILLLGDSDDPPLFEPDVEPTLTEPASSADETVTLDEPFTGEISATEEDDEMRGVFIASVFNINFPSKPGLTEEQMKNELDTIVAVSRSAGLDTLYFQVRPTGDSLYPSEIFPTSRYLVNNEGDAISFDPFRYVIEKAGELGMEVVAWVNPYRVTNFKSQSKEAALAELCDENPAKKNPDWTVFYDGKLYYDPALPQVRDLITSGVREICENYQVAGVIYDDYFYPYKVEGEVFDDAENYSRYGGGLSFEDWRRDNVNQMVKQSYDTVKSVSADMTFGVSPFGIWQNSSSDPKGSDTKGSEAYSQLYCDALAWIEGGYVDYLAPQIYWERGHSAADFATLTRWWSAQVDGTKVKLYIAHAAYRVADFKLGAAEIIQQISYSRSYMGVAGNIQYGFADIKQNTAGIFDALQNFYLEPYVEELPDTGVKGIVYARPWYGMKTDTSAQFVSVASDPRYPVYSAYGKVGRTKSGFFSILMPLQNGDNFLTLTQNGVDYSLKVVKTKTSSTSSNNLTSFSIEAVTPGDKDFVLISSGEKLPVTVTAPAGAIVKATVGDHSVQLSPTKNPGQGGLTREVYAGSLDFGNDFQGERPVSVGRITFSCERAGEYRSSEGPEVRVIPASCTVLAKVTKDYAHLKNSPSSSFYDDFTPASVGMTDRVLSVLDGFAKLSFGGYISRDEIEILEGEPMPDPRLVNAVSEADSEETRVLLDLGAAPPLNYSVNGKEIRVTVYETSGAFSGDVPVPEGDYLFRSIKVNPAGEKAVTVILVLRSEKNYYGFNYSYENGSLILRFRQPQTLSEGDKPLAGKTVLLDAGHGGTDTGAAGFLNGYNEKDLNLSITLALAEKIKALGANVVLSRDGDTTVSLYERMDLLTATDPDLSISVHHNSVNETKNANTARGTWGLYWSPSGISLTDHVRSATVDALGYYDYGTKSQKLALCRNHRFPQTLVEVGFICAPAEFQRALQSDYSDTVAKAIAEGVLSWYRAQEGFRQGLTQ